MAGMNSSTHQPPLTSTSINLPPNSSNLSAFTLDSAAFPLLNASSTSGTFSTNPRFVSDVNGGKDAIPGSDPISVGEIGTQIPKRSYLASLNRSASTSIASSIKLAYEAPKSVSDEPCALFSSGELQTHIESCESFIVGYFVEKKLPYGFLKEKLSSMWNTKGDFSMTIYGEQAFLFNFSLEEDRTGVLELGSVQIANKLFLIRPWSPFIEQQICTISSVPIWMILRDVPLHLWNEMGFSRISSLVGKPIMTDAPTALKSRMSYARVCVEVDANCSFPTELPFKIDDKKYVVRAEYPWKPSYCSHCRSFGHSDFKCSANNAPKFKKIWVPKSSSVDVVPRESEKNLESPEKIVDLNEEGLSVEGSESLIEEGPLLESHEQSNTALERVNGEGSSIPETESPDIEDPSVGLESGKDTEGFERVFRRRKGSGKNRELIRQENICNLSPFSSLENLEVDNSTDFIEASTSRVGEVSVMDLDSEKNKVVFATMSKDQKAEKLINFSSMFLSGDCSDEMKRSIFGEIVEKHQKKPRRTRRNQGWRKSLRN